MSPSLTLVVPMSTLCDTHLQFNKFTSTYTAVNAGAIMEYKKKAKEDRAAQQAAKNAKENKEKPPEG